jgi:hypothetical protein
MACPLSLFNGSLSHVVMVSKTSKRRSKRTQKPVVSSEDWDRRHLPTVQLHESEKLLVGLLALLLLIMPWALGSTHLAAQAVACFLAAASLGAALLPRHGNTHTVTSGGQARRLFSFPVFWFGALLLLYVTVQGFNTSWKVEGTEGFRWLTESNHISWLPSGLAAPEAGPFSWLLLLATPFLAVCAAWIGLTRRKAVIILLGATAINGFFLAAIGFFQIAKSKTEILWFYEPPTNVFLSTFPFHWQGAAYLTILVAIAAGLATHHYARARRTFRRSNPSGLFLFIGLVLMLIVIFSFSRAAAGLAGGIMAAFLAHIAYRELTIDAPLSRKIFLASLALVVVGIGGAIAGNVAQSYLEREAGRDRVDSAAFAGEGSWAATREAGTILFQERRFYGWGAGSFPHLYKEAGQREEVEGIPASLAAEYSASDWIRFPAELGIAGSLLLLLAAGYLLKHYCHLRTLQSPLIGFLLLGVLAGLILALGSPIFSNAAVLTLWSLTLAFGAILTRIEAATRSRTDGVVSLD